MINYAHRGFMGKYPENTMLAFKKAIEAGAKGIELDVQLSKDGLPVIIHDENLDRTTDKRGLVKDMTFDQLRIIKASKGYDGIEEKIPSLREYIEYIRDLDIVTNIEIKNSIIDYEGIEEKIYELIKEHNIEGKVIISSFNHQSLVRFKEIDKDISCAVLEGSRLHKPWEYVEKLNVEYFHPMNFIIDEDIIKEFNRRNIGINIWFPVGYKDFSAYTKLDTEGIITDYPDLINKIIKENQKNT